MTNLKIGIHLDSLGLPLRKALDEASRLGVGGVKVSAVGDLAPANLSATGRREFRNLLRARNLELASLHCPLRRGLDNPEHLEPRLEHVRQVMALAYDLGPRVVTVHAGRVPEKDDDPAAELLRESLTVLGGHGDRSGTTLALETGLESGERLAQFLGRIDSGSLGVNFDPANLLINGFRPLADLMALAGRVTQVQARDARRSSPNRLAHEVPLGAGDLDWLELTTLLRGTDFRGYVVVQRDGGDRRGQDVQDGVAFLRRIL